MRTTVIPAQITTVEDKIAGNLSLTQIFLMMIPVFWGTLVYTIFPPTMHLAWYKLAVVLVVLIFSLGLALRIKGKVVLHWAIILIRYNTRAKYYLFNKNDSHLRIMDFPVFEKSERKILKKAPAKQEKLSSPSLGIKDLVKLEQFIANPKYSYSLKSAKKGGLYVALEQIQK
jgi:hypothetical protein